MSFDNLSIAEAAVERSPQSDDQLLDAAALRAAVADAATPVPVLKQALARCNRILDERYKQNLNINDIVTGRAAVIDEVLRIAWERQDWPDQQNLSLVAVGGYGRGELLPHSDIDLLILTRKDRNAIYKEAISAFLTLLWDIGLEIGQSVRSVKQCKQEASKDITVTMPLMESRTLIGAPDLHALMMEATSSRRVWPTKKFLRAKLDEQIARHEKYHDVDTHWSQTSKTSPGGYETYRPLPG